MDLGADHIWSLEEIAPLLDCSACRSRRSFHRKAQFQTSKSAMPMKSRSNFQIFGLLLSISGAKPKRQRQGRSLTL